MKDWCAFWLHHRSGRWCARRRGCWSRPRGCAARRGTCGGGTRGGSGRRGRSSGSRRWRCGGGGLRRKRIHGILVRVKLLWFWSARDTRSVDSGGGRETAGEVEITGTTVWSVTGFLVQERHRQIGWWGTHRRRQRDAFAIRKRRTSGKTDMGDLGQSTTEFVHAFDLLS